MNDAPWAKKDYMCGWKPNKETNLMYSDPEGKDGTCPVHCKKEKRLLKKGQGKHRYRCQPYTQPLPSTKNLTDVDILKWYTDHNIDPKTGIPSALEDVSVKKEPEKKKVITAPRKKREAVNTEAEQTKKPGMITQVKEIGSGLAAWVKPEAKDPSSIAQDDTATKEWEFDENKNQSLYDQMSTETKDRWCTECRKSKKKNSRTTGTTFVQHATRFCDYQGTPIRRMRNGKKRKKPKPQTKPKPKRKIHYQQ